MKHPWRICPLGEHWRRTTKVRAHFRNGVKVASHVRKGGCAKNSSKLDQIYWDELFKIADMQFRKLKGAPYSNDLGFKRGNEFDELIRGWTHYWNEIFQLHEKLDPNLVKALIATESGFNPLSQTKTKSNLRRATGLLQLTGQTRKVLSDEKGELKDHLVNLRGESSLKNPVLNLAAGIRWLFRKYEIAKGRDKKANWLSAIALYKSYPKNHPQMKKLTNIYNKLLQDD